MPVGAVVVREGEIVGAAQRHGGGWRLLGTVLYVTLEPCPMCAGALQQARVTRLVYGAPDQKVGAAGTVVNPLQNPRLLHRVEIQGGVLADDALRLLRRFFDDRR